MIAVRPTAAIPNRAIGLGWISLKRRLDSAAGPFLVRESTREAISASRISPAAVPVRFRVANNSRTNGDVNRSLTKDGLALLNRRRYVAVGA